MINIVKTPNGIKYNAMAHKENSNPDWGKFRNIWRRISKVFHDTSGIDF